ncbi:uncharacterized protein [Spinacia oleracea]|uniref:RNase H type-1 domain-containing protein n=1 Tax=Spinacia oleracea TaxID=3562 RepID=A0ABM3RNQ9_SPIOL|nr:uncharacterized protein LOC130470739 [Spinacia oleracea]
MMETVADHAHHQLAPVIVEISSLLKREWVIKFVHIPRCFNKVAHELASMALIMKEDNKIHVNIPDYVKDTYEADLKAVNPVFAHQISMDMATLVNDINGFGGSSSTSHQGSATAGQIVFGSIVSSINAAIAINSDDRRFNTSNLVDVPISFEPFTFNGSRFNSQAVSITDLNKEVAVEDKEEGEILD